MINQAHFFTDLVNTRHDQKIRSVCLYLNIDVSEQSYTHTAPSTDFLFRPLSDDFFAHKNQITASTSQLVRTSV